MRPELLPTAARSARQGRSSARASAALALALSFGSGCRPAAPGWSGAGAWRILVKVEPADLGKRSSDEGVARLEISFATLLAGQGVDGEVDLSSLQVHRYEPASGTAQRFKPFESSRSPYDRPCRFEDKTLPEDYPSRVGRASYAPDGRAPLVVRKRKARLFNREMDPADGALVWVHTQDGNQPSHYAIYFDVAPRKGAGGPSPAPWIGDIDVLRRAAGQPLSGQAHIMTAVADLNGDGLFDLVAGAEKGDVIWFPNRGRPGAPKFVGCRILTDELGPIDVGFYSSPFVYDWDADGLPDLLVGTSSNVILWWKNTGDRTNPRFTYKGFLQADGRRLEVPEGPAPEVKVQLGGTVAGSTPGKPAGQRDYFNQPWVGDWNGDGLPDILTGGYTPGLILYY